MLQVAVSAISSGIKWKKNRFENGYVWVEVYPKPWCFGDTGFWRRLISIGDANGRTRKPHDGFPHEYCGKGQIALKLGGSVGFDASNERGKNVFSTTFRQSVSLLYRRPGVPTWKLGTPQNASVGKYIDASRGSPRSMCTKFGRETRKRHTVFLALTLKIPERRVYTTTKYLGVSTFQAHVVAQERKTSRHF